MAEKKIWTFMKMSYNFFFYLEVLQSSCDIDLIHFRRA